MKIQEQAPAKINLALNILGRRTDGYHELRMVMQSVSLCDTVTVEETGIGFALLADGFTVPAGKSSLEQQAAEAFFAAVGRPMPPLTVHLEKTTPAYAGLGGGSADVAALLRCLRRQYAPEMPVEQLRAIGLTVGSDMPFCVSGGTALAEGRGERLTALPALPDCWIVLCKPEFGILSPRCIVSVWESSILRLICCLRGIWAAWRPDCATCSRNSCRRNTMRCSTSKTGFWSWGR